jgi:ZIP family zinc transporter
MLIKILYALIGTGFMFAATSVGALAVFLPARGGGEKSRRASIGFAAGVMLAASVWSLILPAVTEAQRCGQNTALTVGLGFVIGGLIIVAIDIIAPCFAGNRENCGCRSLVFAVTIHNIPEGMAVGLSFAAAVTEAVAAGYAETFASVPLVFLAGPAALAFGMGVQNCPEGAAVAVPLRMSGMSRGRSFLYGVLSGAVEPVAAVLAIIAAGAATVALPFALALAAGAMVAVSAGELMPAASSREGTVAAVVGFAVMMLLDILL